MNFDPAEHHRRSIRLSGYDYSQAGADFVTICTQDRARLFCDMDRNHPLAVASEPENAWRL